MNRQIDIDNETSFRPLSLRERAGIHILMLIFRIVFPAKYQHQLNDSLKPLIELLGSDKS